MNYFPPDSIFNFGTPRQNYWRLGRFQDDWFFCWASISEDFLLNKVVYRGSLWNFHPGTCDIDLEQNTPYFETEEAVARYLEREVGYILRSKINAFSAKLKENKKLIEKLCGTKK